MVVPSIAGRRGNPVLWSRRFFPDLMAIQRRHRRPPPDRRLCRGGRRSAGRRRRGADRRGHARVAFRGQGRNRARLRLRIVDRAHPTHRYLAATLRVGKGMTDNFTPVMRAWWPPPCCWRPPPWCWSPSTARAPPARWRSALAARSARPSISIRRRRRAKARWPNARARPAAWSPSCRRGCAALAVDFSNGCGAHGWGKAAKLGLAQNVALKSCYRDGGKECVIRTFFCDAKG